MIRYRPDVDGLRAVAVLPVLLFHVGVPGQGGGYVGVDVFFVISGFLITAIIHRDVQAGRFSFARFYERRIRRLLPALAVVLVASAVVAYWLLLPQELKDFGQSVLACALFASNFLFFSEAGYFDAPAHGKPLLHTWSLAVEEQFYLVFPPLLILLHRFVRRRQIAILTAVALLTFVANVLVVDQRQSAAFYLIPFRAWELLLGALLALGAFRSPRSKTFASTAGIVGLTLIGGAVVLFSEDTVFPGFAALAPCLGAALVIYAGGSTESLTYRALGWRPLVFIGKISYSLYLWHWPLVVYVRYVSPDDTLSPALKVMLIGASIAAGALSWRFVEQPFRSTHPSLTRRKVFAGALAATAVLIGFGSLVHVTKGFPGRLTPTALRFAEAAGDFQPEPPHCGRWEGHGAAADYCKIGDPEAQDPSFLMWGDSHAGILVHGVDRAARERGVAGLFSGAAGCPPLVGVSKDERHTDAAVDGECIETNRDILKLLASDDELESVLLASRWAYYAQGEGYGSEAFNKVDIWFADSGRGRGRDNNAWVFEQALDATVERLTAMGKRVFLLRQVPELGRYSASSVAKALTMDPEDGARLLEESTTISRASVGARQQAFDTVMKKLDSRAGVRVLDSWGHFCDEETCRGFVDGRPLYFDNNHVTTSTSLSLSTLYAPLFEGRPTAQRRADPAHRPADPAADAPRPPMGAALDD